MAYEVTNGVLDLETLIQNIVSFAVSEAGFTNESTTTDGADTIYHISRGAGGNKIYWNFLVGYSIMTGGNVHEARIRKSYSKITTVTNFNDYTTVADRDPAYTPLTSYHNNGPFVRSHFFSDGNVVHVVLESYNNVFSHMSFGNITKYGTTWTGGEYSTAGGAASKASSTNFSPLGGSYAIPFDAGSNNYTYQGSIRHFTGSAANTRADFAYNHVNVADNQSCRMEGYSYNTNGYWHNMITEGSPSLFNGRSPLFPIHVRFWDYLLSRWRFKGTIPYVRVFNISQSIPSSIIENNWMIFPYSQKPDGDQTLGGFSAEFGLAYKRDDI